jgi:hypothetical protein
MIRQPHRKGRASFVSRLFAELFATGPAMLCTNSRATDAEAANSAARGTRSEQCEKPRERRKNRASIMARGLRQVFRNIVFGV